MKRLLIAIAFLGSSMAMATETNDLSIKDYTLGMQMSDCPNGTLSKAQDGSKLTCFLPATTYAGEPVKNILLTIFANEVITIAAVFYKKGPYALPEVRDALKLRFGKPDSEQSTLNRYLWFKGNSTLGLNGWDGILTLNDTAKSKIAREQNAKTKQSDM